MADSGPPCILVVADPARIRELADALAEPLDVALEVSESSGGDETIELFEQKRPHVVVVTASLELGDPKSLIETLRSMAPRAEVGIVLVGDDTGPIRTALDALDLAPDRFLTRPLAGKALRFAVQSCLEAVELARGNDDLHRPRTRTDQGTGVKALLPANGSPRAPIEDDPTAATRAALRARWEALADSIVDDPADAAEAIEEPAPLPPPLTISPRRRSAQDSSEVWRPGNTSQMNVEAPSREPTLIIRDEPPAPAERPSDPPKEVAITARGSDESWSQPMPLAELAEAIDKRDAEAATPPHVMRSGVHALEDFAPLTPPPPAAPSPAATPAPEPESPGRDFARQLRQKMSMMAQRLFQSSTDAGGTPPVEVGPRHDHQTEIDLASLAEEPALGGGVTEIESRAARSQDARELTTSPGSWDTQVRERGLPDAGEMVRGVSDAPMLLARMFAAGATGRVGFRRDEPEMERGGLAPTRGVEKIVFFDQGRPVFASSNEPGDRMGELLVREGKITAAQYERCQEQATSSGRRMGEILVDFGYLKRRELLPAVRRHVEDIIYSLFGWDHGHYRVHADATPSAERIRLSRHPAALILEGIRRKLDRTALDKLVGPPSTVIEVPDRERLGGIVNASDLAAEERAALAAFDAQADLAQVARTAGVDLADLLPLAWGLCVLGLATARRAEAEVADDSNALVGETDLAIDRERVHARWRLVSESDYFALLGVRRDATAFEIRRAYQAARRDFAADCFPTDLRRELAQELDDIASVLDEAFRVLRDDRLRVTYLSNLIE